MAGTDRLGWYLLILAAFAAIGLACFLISYWRLSVELKATRQDNRRLMHRLGQYHGISLGWPAPPALDTDDGMRDRDQSRHAPAFRYVAKVPTPEKE